MSGRRLSKAQKKSKPKPEARPAVARLARIASPPPTVPMPVPQHTDVARKTLMELNDHGIGHPAYECRFPVGEPTQGFCALPAVPGLSYCGHHAERCHRADVSKPWVRGRITQMPPMRLRSHREDIENPSVPVA